jgi:chromatin remodeling complex protein RSC6
MAAKKPAAKKMKCAPKAASKKTATKKTAAKKTPVKKTAAKKTTTKQAKVRTNSAFMVELQPSAQLAEVVGSKPLPRTKVISQIWDYVKEHGLQDTKDKRLINLDDTLKAVYGNKKQIHMTEVSQAFKHLS